MQTEWCRRANSFIHSICLLKLELTGGGEGVRTNAILCSTYLNAPTSTSASPSLWSVYHIKMPPGPSVAAAHLRSSVRFSIESGTGCVDAASCHEGNGCIGLASAADKVTSAPQAEAVPEVLRIRMVTCPNEVVESRNVKFESFAGPIHQRESND